MIHCVLGVFYCNFKKNGLNPGSVSGQNLRSEVQESVTLRVPMSGKEFSLKTQNIPSCFCPDPSAVYYVLCWLASQ